MLRVHVWLFSIHKVAPFFHPFEFYQYWRNVGDADVLKCIRMLTFLPIEEIEKMDSWEGAQLNEAKDILAYELTQMVHGTEEADKAREASKALFAGGASSENIPTHTLAADDFKEDKVDILQILVSAGLTASRAEARRAVQQGGVSVNGEKVSDPFTAYEKSVFADEFLLKKGKKSFCKIEA